MKGKDKESDKKNLEKLKANIEALFFFLIGGSLVGVFFFSGEERVIFALASLLHLFILAEVYWFIERVLKKYEVGQ